MAISRTLYVALLFYTFLVGSSLGQDCAPTPMNFQTRFLESCQQNFGFIQSTCLEALGTFIAAVATDTPDNVTASSYAPYFALLPPDPGRSGTLFWSRTPQLANMVSCMCMSGNVTSSFNTPSSGIINDIGVDISWCGDPNAPGSLDFVNNCSCSVSIAFFEKLSIELARATTGTFFFLGNGERIGGLFNISNFFGSVELPTLTRPTVTRGVILNVHRMGVGEACGEGSIRGLRRMIEEKRFSYVCYNIYGDVNDTSQVPSLAQCANAIIAAEQQGMEPDPNDCFSMGGAVSTTVSTGWLVLLFLSIMLLVEL